jgi:hypothetical protein
MKKIIIGFFAILGIVILVMGYRVYYVFSFNKQLEKISLDDYDGRGAVKLRDDNFPDYLIKFMADDDLKGKTSNLETLLPDKDKIFDHEAVNKLVTATEAEFSAQNIDDFKQIVPIIKNKMKETKKSTAPSFSESENFPSSPTFKTMRATARYWYMISRVLEQKKDYETSLYLSHAIFYITKDCQSNYSNSGSLINKMICVALNNIACNSIMYWASRPKPQCKELSKEVAKDILDFVKNEYPLSVTIEHESLLIEDVLNSFATKKGGSIYAKLVKSNAYKVILDICYNEPKKNFDKPIYEIKKQMKEFSEKREKLLDDDSAYLITNALLNPDKAVAIMIFNLASPNFSKAKEAYEASLAKMEMTAIALAINSFICEKKKYPESMDELSEWFGSKLPNNRITNEPYELDFKGTHVLYNNSILGNEFYFDFSEN